jgi:AcrR family transcriptional regulator
VAKATFYNHFASKDELVRAYIEEQDQLGREAVARLPDEWPREKVFAIFHRIAEAARQPGYRGCPFLNAAAEYPDPVSPVRNGLLVSGDLDDATGLAALTRDAVARVLG